MARKGLGLGRGLDALLSGGGEDMTIADSLAGEVADDDAGADAGGWRDARPAAAPDAGDAVARIPLDRLVAGVGQPRKNFDEEELRELAASIAEHGVIQPIIAAESGDGTFAIIAGERRTRAARLAGLSEIPAIVREYTDERRLEVSLIENVQRSDLNPIEEAAAYKNLMDFSGLSQEELAARVGKNRSTVANSLRLLRLSAGMQKSLESGEISAGHAKSLLSLSDTALREKLFREIVGKALSVRETERRAGILNAEGAGEEPGAKPAAARSPEITDMEERFIGRLGTKVRIEGDLAKGRVLIEYYSMEDLDRLYGLLAAAPSAP